MPTAPRKTTAPRAPQPKVDLDLTKLDLRPSGPLGVKLNDGQIVRLLDARDLDWQVAARLTREAPFELVIQIVHPDDLDRFLAAKVTQRELMKMLEFYTSYFELPSEGERPA